MGLYSKLRLPRYIDPDARSREKVHRIKDIITQSSDNGGNVSIAEVRVLMQNLGESLTRVNNLLLAFAGGRNHATIFARGYGETRLVKNILKQHLKDIELTLEAYTQLAIDQFEVEGTTSLKLDDGSTVRVQTTPYAGVVDKEVYRLWCIQNGLERELMLWPSKTAALTKERLLEGLPEPDGVKAYLKSSIYYSGGDGGDDE